MLNLLVQNQKRAGIRRSFPSTLRHLGAAGLFFLAILDSSPLPTFGGPDILTAILAASHRPLWYEYAATRNSRIRDWRIFHVSTGAQSRIRLLWTISSRKPNYPSF